MLLRAIAVLAFAFGSLAASIKAEAPAIIGEWLAAQQRMGDLSVPFKLTRTLPSLKAPVVSEGYFWRMGDGRFRWELGVPPATILLYDGRELNLWDASKPQWQALQPNQGGMRMWMHFLNTSELTQEAMTKDFTATVTVSGSDPKIANIALMPKGLMVRRHLKQVDLQIDTATYHLRQIRLIQSDAATVLMTFGSPKPFSDRDRRVSFQPKSS